MEEEKLPRVNAPKAYKNASFLDSREARTIRIVCEFEETLHRLRQQGVKETIMFFGSARAKTRAQYNQAVKAEKEKLSQAKTKEEIMAIEGSLARLSAVEWMCEIVEKVENLAQRLTEWALNYESASGTAQQIQGTIGKNATQSLMVCTGGGPGLMESANRGASRVAGAKNWEWVSLFHLKQDLIHMFLLS